MNENPLTKGVLTENATGIGTVTRGMVRERAVELAAINGHSAQEVSKSEWEDAKRELTGDPDPGPNDAVLMLTTEAERWYPVEELRGHKVPVSPSDDEDNEGRSESAQLFEEGIKEAEHDQMLQAVRNQRPEGD